MNRWLIVRMGAAAVLFCTGLLGSPFAPNPAAPPHGIWLISGIVFGITAFGGFCALGGAYQTQGVTTGWTTPSWYQSPFDRAQPLQRAHFCAFEAICVGAGGLVRALAIAHFKKLPPPDIALGFGLGLWVALRLAVLAFHPKEY
jgi:hypothetical protein